MTDQKRLKRPKRPSSHVKGSIATIEFDHKRSPSWISHPPDEDYGWDRFVELDDNEEATGNGFLVQIKGSNSLNYSNDLKTIRYPLEVSTINYLLDHNMPSMLCVCDTSKIDRPIFYVWLSREIIRIEEQDPNWQNQNTVSIQIPISQELNAKSHSEIETYVKRYMSDMRIASEIGGMIASPHGFTSDIYHSQKNDIQNRLSQEVYSHISDLGLIDASTDPISNVKPLSLKDQKIHKNIKKSSEFLNSFRDIEAEKILKQISKDIEVGSLGVKAMLYNNQGVLALHHKNFHNARKYFTKAQELEQKNVKYSTNLLTAEFHLALNLKNFIKNLPSDWNSRLDSILKINKDYPQALYLKAFWISETKSVLAADILLKKSIVWKKYQLDSIIVLADIYLRNGKFDKAIGIFKEAESSNMTKDERFWSLFGNALFIKAIGIKDISKEMELKGPGPSNINRNLLVKAEKCYNNAINLFKSKGMPLISEETIANETAVLLLLGQYKKSEIICRHYLEYHSNSIPILENLVSSLNFQDDQKASYAAIQYAKLAYSHKPDSTYVFCNFILTLYTCEEFDEIMEIVLLREKKGFLDKNEEGLAKAFLAISYFELGFHKESQIQIAEMKKESRLTIDAILAEVAIMRKQQVKNTIIIKVLKDTLRENPKDNRILTKIVQLLEPDNKTRAKEAIKFISQILKIRQLTPEEYSSLGKAFLKLDKPENAQDIFYNASIRYPEDLRFFYLAAISNHELGREDEAYKCLKEYFKKSNKDYLLLKNLAILANNIGKSRESIKLFERALYMVDEPDEKAELHCILYEIKTRLKWPKKEILKHVNDYGKIYKGDVNAEARYLIMFMLSPELQKDEIDAEVKKWVREFNQRLNIFSREHPRFNGLMSIKIPKGIPDDEKIYHILSQLAYLTLPQRLALAPFELAIKSQPWPFVIRSRLLPKAHSLFEYWNECTGSDQFCHAIHIWRPINDLVAEKQNSNEKDVICIDINALLTLVELNLLEYLTKCFNKIIIARGTKSALNLDLSSPFINHPLLEKIEKWRLNNLKNIRVRNFQSHEFKGQSINNLSGYQKKSVLKEKSFEEIMGYGVGESLLLAKKLICPLYSDDSFIRELGVNKYKIKTFSTISFLSRLIDEKHLSLREETLLYSQMIKKNFRLIPFQPYHLTTRLEMIVNLRNNNSLPPSKQKTLIQDSILGVFLKQFGESSIPPHTRVNLAINWWISILQNKQMIKEQIEECMEYISFCLSKITKSGVIKGISKHEDEHNAAILWALFWWKCNQTDSDLSCFAWSAIKESCKRLFAKDEACQLKILFKLIPFYIINTINSITNLDKDTKLELLFKLTDCFKFGELDKDKLDEALAKLMQKIK